MQLSMFLFSQRMPLCLFSCHFVIRRQLSTGTRAGPIPRLECGRFFLYTHHSLFPCLFKLGSRGSPCSTIARAGRSVNLFSLWEGNSDYIAHAFKPRRCRSVPFCTLYGPWLCCACVIVLLIKLFTFRAVSGVALAGDSVGRNLCVEKPCFSLALPTGAVYHGGDKITHPQPWRRAEPSGARC